MPVKRDAAAAVETGAQRVVRLELEAMLERGSADEAEARGRIAALIELDRELEPAEQAEFERFVARRDKQRAKRRRQSRRFEARSARARRRWAERAGTPWAAKWEARAIEAAERYDRTLVHGHLSGEQFYWLHVVTQVEKAERRAARQHARDEARWAAEAVEREAKLAALTREHDGDVTSPRVTTTASAMPSTDEPEVEAAPRRPRLKVGIVAQYDAQGRRVQ
jgi:hypothetical protein